MQTASYTYDFFLVFFFVRTKKMSKRQWLSMTDKFEKLNEVDKGIKKKDIVEKYRRYIPS